MAITTGQDRAAPRSGSRLTVSRGSLTRTLGAALRRARSAAGEARHLHALEKEGEVWETPFIAILGLFLFFLPIFLVMLGVAFAAYYLA